MTLRHREVFYASSACVYNGDKQTDPDNPAQRIGCLPALAEDGYVGKNYSVKGCVPFNEDSDYNPVHVSIMFTVLSVPGMEEGKKRRQQYAVK